MEKDIIKLVKARLPEIIQKRNEFTQKPDGSFVSDGDLMCDDLLRNFFSKNLPNHIYITEEHDRPTFCENVSYVIVDPIDGTENFISGIPLWGIGISIWTKGEHEFSMIAIPELNIFISSESDFKDSIYYSRTHGLSSSLDEKLFLSEIKGKREVRIFGCCMFSMFLLLNGSLKSFANPVGANVWDIMPGVIISKMLGYEVLIDDKNYDGKLLDFNKKHTFRICKR